jgi:protein O-GlcNAc transferase
MKLLLVCGPWSSGTSVVAGLLARLGAIGFGPYFSTNDERTSNSYELTAFRGLVQSFASEQTLSLKPGIDVKAQIRRFHDRIVNQEFGHHDEKSDAPIFLKYPLSALVIPQICEVFETRLIYVLRPLRDIEATRRRRGWPEQLGAKGAEIIYSCMFTALVNHPYPTIILRYPELVASPIENVCKLARFAGLPSGSDVVQEASKLVREPDTGSPTNRTLETVSKMESDIETVRSGSDPQGELHDAPTLFDQALAFFQAGRIAEAEGIARRVLQITPKNFQALHLLGIIFSQRGNHAEGLRFIDAAVQIKAQASLYNSRGNVLAALKQFDEALTSFETAIALDPQSPLAFGNLGNVYREVGRFDEAIASYDEAIALDPGDAEVFYNRGVVLQELNRFHEAIASYDKAIALKPGYAEALSNRGTVLQALGRLSEAVTSYDRAIALKPNFPEALCSRGSAFQELNRFDEAIASYNEAIALKSDLAEAFNYRGMSFEKLGRMPEALASFEKAIALKPDYAEAYENRGIVLNELKRFDEALASYDRAIVLRPDYAKAFNNRGIVLKGLKRFDEALASYDRAIVLRPDRAELFNNRGIVLNELKRFDEALASYVRAIVLKPDYAEAFNNRAIVLKELKRFDEALASCDRAIVLRPDYAEAFNNRGIVLYELKQFDEALASYERAITLKPDYADALNNRGAALEGVKRFDEALASYEQALAAQENHSHAVSGIADCALKLNDWRSAAKIVEVIEANVTERKSIVHPFVLLGYSSDAALQLKCAQNYIADKIASPTPLWNGTRWHHDKVRIAYLSADFHQHPTAYLTSDLFAHHARSHFEVLGVSFGGDDGSTIRSRLIKSFDQFHDVRFKSDDEVAKLLSELQVDIAVDLKGYTQDARPGILAHRPVPIQVNYLGYPGTMGADFINYVIADKIVLPFDQQPYYTERIVHLPECYQVNSQRELASRKVTRHEVGLPENGFVFCCFSNNYKITAPVFDIWMRLLRAIDGSVLWLLRENSSAEKNLRQEAKARGVDPARLVFADRTALVDHLERHRLADLFLDTLPYNAHTTASDALWAELPLVTCCGRSFSGRVAASILNAIGLPELVTPNLEDYEALALQLARNAPLLVGIKARLAHNRNTYPLFDSKRFTRHIEAAYTTMWQIWQRGERPQSFSVQPNS